MGSVREDIFHVDSRDRDTAAYPSALSYRIDMSRTTMGVVRNVKEVEILALSFPRVDAENYVVMHVEELFHRVESTNNECAHSVGVFYFDNYNLPKGEVKSMKGKDYDPKIVKFDPPLSSLQHLTIRFSKYGGAIEAADITPEGGLPVGVELGQHSIVFRFVTQGRAG
jgi:hypothetical protein